MPQPSTLMNKKRSQFFNNHWLFRLPLARKILTIAQQPLAVRLFAEFFEFCVCIRTFLELMRQNHSFFQPSCDATQKR